MRRGAIVLAIALVPLTANAEIRDLDTCRAAIEADAATAREEAALWLRLGGGVPARLCEALAVQATGAERQAAVLLTELAQDDRAVIAGPVRADILDQAGALWLALGEDEIAVQTLIAAESLAPEGAGRLVRIARLSIDLGQTETALEAASAALRVAPKDAEARLVRAQAHRAAGNLWAARADLDQVPTSPQSLLEDARLTLAEGRKADAQTLLLKILDDFPDMPEADQARGLLQDISGG